MNNSHMRGLASQPQPSDQADDEWKLERVAGVDGWPPHALIEESGAAGDGAAEQDFSLSRSCSMPSLRTRHEDFS